MKRCIVFLAAVTLVGCAQQPDKSPDDACQPLHAQIAEQQRLQREQARRIDELQRLAAERQRRADELQQKLDALRAIDRDMRRPEPRK